MGKFHNTFMPLVLSLTCEFQSGFDNTKQNTDRMPDIANALNKPRLLTTVTMQFVHVSFYTLTEFRYFIFTLRAGHTGEAGYSF